MAEQKVIMTDPRQEDYFYQEAIKTLERISSLPGWM